MPQACGERRGHANRGPCRVRTSGGGDGTTSMYRRRVPVQRGEDRRRRMPQLIVFGIFAELFVRSSLVEPGDPGATAGNIRDAEGLFRIGLASDLVMPMFHAIVAAALHVLLRPLSAGLALLATFFRLVHAPVYGVTLLTPFLVLQVADAPAREWSRLPGRPRRQRAGCARAVVRRGAQVTDGSSRCSSSACTS